MKKWLSLLLAVILCVLSVGFAEGEITEPEVEAVESEEIVIDEAIEEVTENNADEIPEVADEDAAEAEVEEEVEEEELESKMADSTYVDVIFNGSVLAEGQTITVGRYSYNQISFRDQKGTLIAPNDIYRDFDTILVSNLSVVDFVASSDRKTIYVWGKSNGTATVTVKSGNATRTFHVNVVANKKMTNQSPTKSEKKSGKLKIRVRSIELASPTKLVCQYYLINGRNKKLKKFKSGYMQVNLPGGGYGKTTFRNYKMNIKKRNWKKYTATYYFNNQLHCDLTRLSQYQLSHMVSFSLRSQY